MAISVSKVQAYMGHGLNVLISGEHGTGKTAILRQAAENLGWNMKYFSTPTLDPYVDLGGLPVPREDTRTVEFFRQRNLDEAHVIFFDEVNRPAEAKTNNAILEIVQFGTINGERLPNLKVVVAAMNPNTEDYDVVPLDAALRERFDMYLQSDTALDLPYFKSIFGDGVASEVAKWHRQHETLRNKPSRDQKRNPVAYISPRRMEKIVKAFLAIPSRVTVTEALPPVAGAETLNIDLYKMLTKAVEGRRGAGSQPVLGANVMSLEVKRLAALGDGLRLDPSRRKAERLLSDPNLDPTDRARLVTALAVSLNKNVGPEVLLGKWGFVVKTLSPSDQMLLTKNWNASKKSIMRTVLAKEKISPFSGL